ncbi:hypothetical protein LZ30DRAFT_416493 [Colletotrichum cereale]|nr:hypothetical protein LZ30DRAFT_416493 [Colletotrichum cereale]
MSKSWSASNVTIRELSKESQARHGQGLWINEATNSLWIWGGKSPNGAPRENPPASWKFTADGEGGGKWSKETPANPTFFTDLKRSEDGAFASTPDAGFWFGGKASGLTNPNPVPQAVPGMVTYNMTTKSWANETTALSENGTVIGSSAVYIPTFGPNGLITIMGGYTEALDPGLKGPTGWLDFANLTFLDPVTRKWYSQATTGNPPTARAGFCSVGVNGTNGTYEIFVFGGTNEEKRITYDDVFVLSLPGFTWTQIIYNPANPRRYHSCAIVGNRQMLSVGGTDGQTAWSTVDPWPQGLGLFDMTDWTWKTDYDANAEAYETSSIIRDWYKNKYG